MTEHVGPVGDQFIHCAADGLERRYVDAFESALLTQYTQHGNSIRAEFVMAKKIYDIIKIARPRPFRERADLFAKYFLICVAPSGDPACGQVAVRMSHGTIDRRQNQQFVDRQIKFYSGRAAGALQWAFVIQATLAT